jgi:hypothetical protein
MKNQVIKVLNREHGKKVIEYWNSQGVYTLNHRGIICEDERDTCIYYGVINGEFSNYSLNYIKNNNAEIIELPIKEEFNMTTNEGRLAYAKKHYPIGTVIKSIHTDTKLKLTSEPRIYFKTTIISESDDRGIDVYHAGVWAKIIEDEQQEEIVMETQRLTRQGLKEIHSVACSNWKGKLEGMGIRNPLEDYIELTQEEVNAMFGACTKDQLPIVSKYLKQDDGSVDIKKLDFKDNHLIARRKYGEYKNKAFWLTTDYDWILNFDNQGELCLIPTKKK